jgi:hypothetical protein
VLFAHENTLAGFAGNRIFYSLNHGERFSESELDFSVEHIVGCEDLVAAWTADSEVVVLRVPHVMARLAIRTDMAVCIYASAVYGRVVLGMGSARLLIIALNNARCINAVDLDGLLPLRVLITPGSDLSFCFFMVASLCRL